MIKLRYHQISPGLSVWQGPSDNVDNLARNPEVFSRNKYCPNLSLFWIFFPHTKVCFGALLREGVCYIGTGFLESPSTCGNIIKFFIRDRSNPKGEWGEKDQQVSTRSFHINLAAALTSYCGEPRQPLGIDLCLTYHFCPQVCSFPWCKVMKARREKKQEPRNKNKLVSSIRCFTLPVRDCAAMFCTPWLNK